MRHIDYADLHGETAHNHRRLSLADILRHYPYLLSGGLIPPAWLANELLRRGGFDAGMSGAGRWTPVEVSAAEYEEVIADLVANGLHGRPLRYLQLPDWVKDHEDWSIWVAEQTYSIPAAENRQYHAAMAELQAAATEAVNRGDEDARVECLVRLNRICAEWSEFVTKHRKLGASI